MAGSIDTSQFDLEFTSMLPIGERARMDEDEDEVALGNLLHFFSYLSLLYFTFLHFTLLFFTFLSFTLLSTQ